MKRVDILLPIYNGLTYVRECIDNVLTFTDKEQYNLYLLDDGSDENTAEHLLSVAENYNHLFYIKNEKNLGFVESCNNGFDISKSEWAVLLNSDVLVTDGWLDKLLECGDSDPAIAGINPLTNHASQINVPMAQGCNYKTINRFFSSLELPKGGYPDIVTGVGFCIMLRRSLVEPLGLFDEIYGKGYCEESDLCMRLTTNGYRVVVNPQVYVYHKGRATFTDRGERYKKNRIIFDERWLAEYKRQFEVFIKLNPIEPYRQLMLPRERWDPVFGSRLAFRNVRSQFLHKHYLNTVKAIVRSSYDALRHYSTVFDPDYYMQFQAQSTFSVTYVLHNLTVAGGILSVIQLVNQLTQRGVDARIVALREYPEVYDWQLLTRPIIYQTPKEMIANIPQSDLVVATHWTTAEWVADIVRAGKARQAAYFLQDYEPWFFSAGEVEERKAVSATYSQVNNKIVKSDWLAGMMADDGYATTKIRLGMNLDVFYPRGKRSERKSIQILAMARPRTPRRGYDDLLVALDKVWEASRDKVKIVFFGEETLPYTGNFEFENIGVVSHQNTLAELYSDSDIFIDSSVFQGFGRSALEAMACGTACVVTNVGGVNEYAKNGKNCIAVAPSKPSDLSEAILTLINDAEMRGKFSTAGLETAQMFCHRREGRETFDYFTQLLNEER